MIQKSEKKKEKGGENHSKRVLDSSRNKWVGGSEETTTCWQFETPMECANGMAIHYLIEAFMTHFED